MPRCHFDNHEAICFNDGMRQQDYPVVGCTSRCNYGTFDIGRVTHQDCSSFDCERCRCSASNVAGAGEAGACIATNKTPGRFSRPGVFLADYRAVTKGSLSPLQLLYSAFGAVVVAGSALRACKAMAIIAEPPNSMLMPTSNPSAQAAVPGKPPQMMAAKMRSMMPLISIQPHRPESSFLCSNAYRIESTPSMMKNAIRSNVSETAPGTGQPSKTIPAAIASTADRSDHQNPGAWRAQNVVTRPTTPLMRNSQPKKIVTAMVAMGGIMIANRPRMTRTMPSIRNKTQCSRIDCVSARCSSLAPPESVDIFDLPRRCCTPYAPSDYTWAAGGAPTRR